MNKVITGLILISLLTFTQSNKLALAKENGIDTNTNINLNSNISTNESFHEEENENIQASIHENEPEDDNVTGKLFAKGRIFANISPTPSNSTTPTPTESITNEKSETGTQNLEDNHPKDATQSSTAINIDNKESVNLFRELQNLLVSLKKIIFSVLG